MSYLKDLFSRPAKDEFPTRVHGKTADEWAAVHEKAETARILSDHYMYQALDADWRKDPVAYAKHYGESGYQSQQGSAAEPKQMEQRREQKQERW